MRAYIALLVALVMLASPVLAVSCGDVNYGNESVSAFTEQHDTATWTIDWRTCGTNETIISAVLESNLDGDPLTNHTMTGTGPTFTYTGEVSNFGTIVWKFYANTNATSNNATGAYSQLVIQYITWMPWGLSAVGLALIGTVLALLVINMLNEAVKSRKVRFNELIRAFIVIVVAAALLSLLLY